jgi:DNA polymerase-1
MTKTLINVDLSQAELRCMAIFSGDQWMIDALQEGQGDFFDNHLMPVAYPYLLGEYESIGDFKTKNPVSHKEKRTKVKAVQYGLAFGRQAPAIARDLEMPVAEAQAIIDNYLRTAYKFDQWRFRVMEAAITPAKRDLLVNPFGRRFQSEVITTRNQNNVQREALSFLPQSTSSDICLSTAIRISPALRSGGYNIFNVVHDAIMIEGDEDGADEVGKIVCQALSDTGAQIMGTQVPFLAEFSVGHSWSDLD